MPVEIRELIIRAVTTGGSEGPKERPSPLESADDRGAVIEACVKQVMRILQKTKER